MPHGADASIAFGASAKSVNLLFPRGCLDVLIEDRARAPIPPLLFDQNPALIGLISLLEMALLRPGLSADMLAEQAMRSLALILAGIDPHGFITESDRIAITPARLRRVIDFIEANLHETLTLEQLAQVAGLSVFHFSRVFRRATTGRSPYHSVCQRRVLKAQAMLMAVEWPIHDIAAACGFARHANFCAAFACARGLLPSAYGSRFVL